MPKKFKDILDKYLLKINSVTKPEIKAIKNPSINSL